MEIPGAGNTLLFSRPVTHSTGEGAVTPHASHTLTSSNPYTAQSSSPVTTGNPKRADTADISDSGKAASAREAGASRTEGDDKRSNSAELTTEEQQQVEQLQERDREVRQHELAHAAVGGQYAGAAKLEYTRGPDGRLYASSGEVSIDTSAVSGDPQATIEKMQTVIRAAMAPAEPSSQDRRVAAQAQALMAEAVAELAAADEADESESASEGESAGEQDSPAAADGAGATGQADTVAGSAPSSLEREGSVSTQGSASVNLHQEMERRLVSTGVFTKAFPEGSLIEQLA